MRNEEELWTRVHASLDQRTDPRGDAEVQSYLAAHPESLAEFERLVDRLEGVQALPRARRAWPTIVGALAAAGVLGFVSLVEPGESGTDGSTATLPPEDELAAHPPRSAESKPAVLHYRLEVATSGPEGRRSTTTQDGNVRHSTEGTGDRSRTTTRLTVAQDSRRQP